MSRSIRSSLFLMVAPFAVTFTLAAWVVDSKIGPWLGRPLIQNCTERGFSSWICGLQDGLFAWLALGLGILVLLSVTAWLSLSLFRSHLNALQQDVMDFQKGHRSQLPDAPREMNPLVQLLNRILQSALADPAGATTSRSEPAPTPLREDPPKPATEPYIPAEPVARPEPPPAPSSPGVAAASPMTEDAPIRPEAPVPPAPRTPRQARPEPLMPEPAPAPAPPPPARQPDEQELEISLQELDADLEQALADAEASLPETQTQPAPQPQESVPGATGNVSPPEPAPRPGPKKNESFPARKCRKLIAILGHRYPDVNFELITDVTEDVPWSIREAELTEVFGELLDNAGKWAAAQVNVFLAIKGNMLVFGVADDGPGVNPELMPHLGEEDFRPEDDQAPGRGLPAVRRVIDSHGGSLAFDRSRLGGLEAIAALPGSPVPRHAGVPGMR